MEQKGICKPNISSPGDIAYMTISNLYLILAPFTSNMNEQCKPHGSRKGKAFEKNTTSIFYKQKLRINKRATRSLSKRERNKIN